MGVFVRGHLQDIGKESPGREHWRRSRDGAGSVPSAGIPGANPLCEETCQHLPLQRPGRAGPSQGGGGEDREEENSRDCGVRKHTCEYSVPRKSEPLGRGSH